MFYRRDQHCLCNLKPFFARCQFLLSLNRCSYVTNTRRDFLHCLRKLLFCGRKLRISLFEFIPKLSRCADLLLENSEPELELELILTRMTQGPGLWVVVFARA